MDEDKEDNSMEETKMLDAGNEVIDKAEDLMTDMKLDDETDYVREMTPEKNWIYHIEIFPWSADDINENLIKIFKLATFSHIALKKKQAGGSNEQEKLDDKIQSRQRKGCLHLYVDTLQTAKTVIRSVTWKAMNAKELTFEITRQDPESNQTETAYFVADTYLLSKVKFREKGRGELKDRSAKISNVPGTISREFLDVVFSRSYVIYDAGSASDLSTNKEKKMQLKLQEMDNFNGSFDIDCLTKVSCRSLVLAYKSIFICGQKISLAANNEQTMVEPPPSHNVGDKGKKTNTATKAKEPSSRGKQLLPTPSRGQSRGRASFHNQPHASNSATSAFGRGIQRETSAPFVRPRGMGRASLASFRPASAPFTRAGPGMPVPMTGRQKMNEKLRRQNPGSAGSTPFMMSGAGGPSRANDMGSVGDSFKHEIASLQNQIECNTQALVAQIARLKEESNYFNDDMGNYNKSQWQDDTFDYGNEEADYMYDDVGFQQQEFRPAQNRMQHFQSGFPQQPPQSQGFLRTRGMRRGGINRMPAPSESSRMQMMQSRGRGSEIRRGGRGRNMKPTQNFMSVPTDSSVFW